MSSRATGGSLQTPVMPSNTEIASYRTYAGTQAAVDFLSDEGFDVRSITIIGADLRLVERVTGRLTMTKAALSGTSSSALWGAFIGLMMSSASTNQSALPWILFGIAGDALVETFMPGFPYIMTDGHRDFTSQSQVVASRYAALVSARIDQTFELSQRSLGNQMHPRLTHRRPGSKGPSEYSSRPDERPRFGVRLSGEGEGGGTEAPRDNKHAAPVQKPAETTVESAESSRKSLD